jgi:hypothetical protein
VIVSTSQQLRRFNPAAGQLELAVGGPSHQRGNAVVETDWLEAPRAKRGPEAALRTA